MKKKIISIMALAPLAALLLVVSSASAADPVKRTPSPKQQAQYQKMKTCNATAKEKGLKGEERKKFMSQCLKNKPEGASQTSDKRNK